MTDRRLRRDDPVFIESVSRAPVCHFIPSIGHFVSQSQTECETLPQFYFILKISRRFERAIAQRYRIPIDREWIARDILKKCENRGVARAPGGKLRGPSGVLMDVLEPHTGAERVLAFSEPQIVSECVIFPDSANGIDSIGRHDGRRRNRRCPASDDDLSRITVT